MFFSAPNLNNKIFHISVFLDLGLIVWLPAYLIMLQVVQWILN